MHQVKKRVYVDLNVGDVIRFGLSSRLYIFQGPHDLMPPETDLKSLRTAKNRQERQDMEASLLRAKVEASRADGISWGMQEDAVEENEDDVEEITWQTYKGQLTEKQEKTREKVIKRLEKIAHMKKEIDAIRAKDIAQGGLTQGQQTQIARNEQRMSQIMEELENLEETLNESIRESLGARGKLSRGKKGAVDDDEEDYLSDDDEFYDRTKKSSKHKPGENQSVETADSLLDKKDALTKQIQDKEKLLLEDGEAAEQNEVAEAGDALDAYMSAVSSELVLDRKEKLQKEMSTLQSELDRILYLLRIADPTGEAAKKRESKVQNPKTIVSKKPSLDTSNRPVPQKNLEIVPSSSKNKQLAPVSSPVKSSQEKTNANSISEPDEKNEDPESKNEESGTPTVFTVAKPQWLGAVEDRQKQETAREDPVDTQDTANQFVDYKDREKILNKTESLSGDQGIEDAAPGLIIRKRKQVEKSKDSEAKDPEVTNNNNGAGFKAEDAVALLLRHSRGYHASEEEDGSISGDVLVEKEGKKEGKKAKRVLGPDKPAFVDEPDYTTWVPPEGQSGDGRTSLNDRFGY
ncbi:SMAD/FHA domain-containing protein [Striga hermonthica]|uniref:SMAD/FHA domain-containing protein n=1 Tax=Striga hermonthica TaxID=68872 RepID=A0A9N7REW4_STRHE|nr:SMAD/FHA domain-containing protein [Striga hermonthica]